MQTIRQLTAYLETLAPLAYQESYDNAGLLVGNPDTPITGVLVTLDCTEAVVAEAVANGCNLIVAHHPIVFRGLKKLTGSTYIERTVISAIRHDVAIYASHTNLDSVTGGVNFRIAEQLGLQNVRILTLKPQTTAKLVTFVPLSYTQTVLDALHDAGAGNIGNYSRVSYRNEGMGSYMANEHANPAMGSIGEYHQEPEHRIEVVFPKHLQAPVLAALRRAHPYEEIAYDIFALETTNHTVGSGIVGELPEPISETDWLHYLKNRMNLPLIRHTPLLGRPVHRVAVCGGAGGFPLNDAIRAAAAVFVTADYKYHEYFDADGRIIICDIGHYESEAFTKDLIVRHLAEKFTTFAVIFSETDTNPVRYFK